MILFSNQDFYFANYFQNTHMEKIFSQTIETKTFACFGFPFLWHLCIETDRRLANDNTNGARFIKQNVTRFLQCTDLTRDTLANDTMCTQIISFFFYEMFRKYLNPMSGMHATKIESVFLRILALTSFAVPKHPGHALPNTVCTRLGNLLGFHNCRFCNIATHCIRTL